MKKLSALGISLFILLIFARFPFGSVLAVSYVIDEYGRVLVVNAYGQVLGDESGGMMMPPSGGEQPSQPSQPQPQQQPQTQQQYTQQPQGQPQQQMQQYQNMQQYGSSNGQQGRTNESSQGQQGQQSQLRPNTAVMNERMKTEFEQRFQNANPKQQELMKKDMERMRISAKNGQLKAEGPGIGGSVSGSNQGQFNQGQFNQGQFKNGSPGASQFGQSGGASFKSFGAGANVDSIKVKESAEKNTVEIKARGNEMELNQQGVRARTAFPISVGANNQLIVTTPNGQQQTVTVLPNEAIKELMKNGIVTGFAGSPTGTAGTVPVPTGTAAAGGAGEQGAPTNTGNTRNVQQDVELTQENGKLEYKVTGTKEAKFLGLYPVKASVEARVSASTGATTSITQPWYFSTFGFLFR